MTVQEPPRFDKFFVSPSPNLSVGVTEPSISPTESGEASPTLVDDEFPSRDSVLTTQKKKKKKLKKSAEAKEATAAKAKALLDSLDDERLPVLCMNRNKHRGTCILQ